MNDNNTDIYRVFDEDVTTDVAIGTSQTATLDQSFTLKEIDFSDIFTMKTLKEIYFSFENVDQGISVDVYMGGNRYNGQKARKNLSVAAVPLGVSTLGE